MQLICQVTNKGFYVTVTRSYIEVRKSILFPLRDLYTVLYIAHFYFDSIDVNKYRYIQNPIG